ncbi:hypothetical protein ShirakiTB12_35700 [Priestia megaterium]|uniref:Uncharacterized protein n=2 Tax=Bacillaceae TaxID=186817 RepID=A0AAX6BMX0_PRIMG|nr:hypothetical protein ShirakiTB12_35700 [Priestia megaterium]
MIMSSYQTESLYVSTLRYSVLYFFLLNANVEEEEKMRLLEDIVISVKEAHALAKTIV